jgi:hypothetical protein
MIGAQTKNKGDTHMKNVIFTICIVLILALNFTGCSEVAEELFDRFYEEEQSSNRKSSKTESLNYFAMEENEPGHLGSFRLESSSAPANSIADDEIYDGMTVAPGDYMIFLVRVEGAEDNSVEVTSNDNIFIRTTPAKGYTTVYVSFRDNGKVKLRLTSVETGESEILHIVVQGDNGRANKEPHEW